MFKLIINNFNVTNNCIILATPLILFMTLLGMYVGYVGYAADNPYKLFFSIVTFMLMFCGFLSAWLYMAKKTLSRTKEIIVLEKDREKSLLKLFMYLPKGIGRLLLPITGVIATYIIMYLIMFSMFAFVITKIRGLSEYWDIMWISGVVTLSFLTILWIPEIVYNEKNAIKALYNSIIKIFMNFKNTLILYVYIAILLLIVLLIYIHLDMHPIFAFFTLILFYYILVYLVVLLFSYYEQKFIK